MGITIHYEGTLRSEADLAAALDLAQRSAVEAGWPVEVVDTRDGLLERVVGDDELEYQGRVRGVVLQPHADAEPLALLFGDDLFVQDYCKTQFAGAAVHIAVVELLTRLAPHFETLDVLDEGEYWDTRDTARLGELLSGFDRALAELVEENPEARVKVRLPGGRILDALA